MVANIWSAEIHVVDNGCLDLGWLSLPSLLPFAYRGQHDRISGTKKEARDAPITQK
jgi:hypothetical protein